MDTTSHVIGIWSTADRKVIGIKKGGGWVQVSRLANPLVNEVIIPTGLKDPWNASGPAQEGRFEKYYKAPILAAVMNKLYKLGVKETDRSDLVSVFLTGVPKLNFTSSKLAEELRINLSTPVTPAGKVSRLGVLGGDVQGWPNGRRLGDDVIDIAERAVAGALIGKKVDARRRRQQRQRQADVGVPVRGRPAVRVRQHEGALTELVAVSH